MCEDWSLTHGGGDNDVMQQVSFDLNRSSSARAGLPVKWIVRAG